MTRHIRVLIAIALGLAAMSASVHGQGMEVRGLDFTSFIHLERGMTEGQLLGIAGQPDLLADKGFVERTFARAAGVERNVLAVRTYTYLPTASDPYTTTITLVGGQISYIRRDMSF